jgi:glycosyltransferase involved in cell wall biosynthesis
MHVALLQEYFVPNAPGGAEFSALVLARELAARGLRVTVITLDLADGGTRAEAAELDAELARQGVRVRRLPFPRRMKGAPQVFPSYIFGNRLTEAWLGRALGRVLRRIAPDLVHVQGVAMLAPARRVCRALHLPVAFTVRDYRVMCPAGVCLHRHENPPGHLDREAFTACARDYLETYAPDMPRGARWRYWARRRLEWSARNRQAAAFADLDAAVYVSDAVRRIFEAGGLTARRNVVVHNLPAPAGQAATPATELRRRFDLRGGLVLFVGRWSLGKGAEEMAAAWRRVGATQPQAKLIVVGRRETDIDLPPDSVVFTGPLPHADVVGLMNLAAVFALPSRWPEPYARTALEAMAAGKPIVAMAAGGNPELVVDGKTGYLVPRGDVDALAGRLDRLLGDPALARKLGAAGRKKLSTPDAQPLDRLLELYETLVAEHRPPLRICAPATSLSDQTVQGGGVFHVKNLQALADQGVHCTIPLAFRTDHEPRAGWDVRVLPIRRTFKLGALFSNVVFGLAVLWLVWGRRRKFDLLRIGDLYHMGPGLIVAARLCRLPTIGVVHHIDHERGFENRVVGWTARRLAGLLVPSQATAEDVAVTFDVDAPAIHPIVEGAPEPNEATPKAAAAKKHFGLAGKQVIGFVGGLQARKNLTFLLDSFAALAPDHPRARLLLVGEGPDRAALEGRAATLGIADRVYFAGRLFDNEKAVALAAMDIFAFPSLNEGFGLAVVEAMAAGVAPLVSDRGSLPEVVHDGRTGIVAPLDQFAWRQTLADLLGDPQRRRALGAAARRYVAEHFTWDKSAAQSEAAMRAVLRQNRGHTLSVLLNSGDSLAVMRREGQEGRFVDHYLSRYAAAFSRVHVFSYGPDRARPYGNAAFVPGRPRWKGPLYAAMMPLTHRMLFRETRLVRVMQTGAALPAIAGRLLMGVRYVTTYGYLYGDFMRVKGRPFYGLYLDVLERAALHFADRVIVTTPSLREHVQQFVLPGKIELLPNGVDLRAFSPGPRRARNEPRIVLFVGRLTAQKNLPLLLEALAPLGEGVKLVIAGQGEGEAALIRQADALGVSLELRGSVPHEQLPALHRAADVFVLPSRIEGHPKALVEAMASGLPCIGADAPGIRDVIADEENGLLVPADVAALSAAIARVLDDDQLAARLGAGARRTAEEQFDLDRLLAREIDLLTRVAEGD